MTFEISKWTFPGILKEVIYTEETFEDMKKTLSLLIKVNDLKPHEVFEKFHILEMETGKVNGELFL